MHITAGSLKGRKLLSPEGGVIRPSASRTREAMLNLLLHAPPPEGLPSCIVGQRIADLCCGSGLLGFEALSRGAEALCFVDADRQSLALTRANARHLRVEEKTSFLQADIRSLPSCPQPCAAVFADPPYRQGLEQPLIAAIVAGNWLVPGGYLALEMAAEDALPDVAGLDLYRDRRYGKARVAVFRRAP